MQQQIEQFEIKWAPGATSARFYFKSHDQARAFVEKFCEATRLFHEQLNQPKKARAEEDEVPFLNGCPVRNFMPGWVYIYSMPDLFINRASDFRLDISGRGENAQCYMETIIQSILTHGPSITPEQFRFQAPAEHLPQEEEWQRRFPAILAVVKHRNLNPQVKLQVERIQELPEWFRNEDHYRKLMAEIDSDLKISWLPGSDCPKLKFTTHEKARDFVLRFLEATRLWIKTHHADEYQGDNHRRKLANGESIPENHMRGCIYINHMNDFFVNRDIEIQFISTMVASNQGYDITALLESIIQYGPAILATQFNFKPNWQGHTHAERQAERSEAAIRIISTSRNHPDIAFDFEDYQRELKLMMRDEYVQRAIAAIEALNHQGAVALVQANPQQHHEPMPRNPNEFFAAAAAAEPIANVQNAATAPQADNAELLVQPSLAEIKYRLLQLVPGFMTFVNSADNAETLIRFEAMFNRAMMLCSDRENAPRPMEIDEIVYHAPPSVRNSNN